MAGLCYSGLISYVTQPNIANICCLGCTVSKKENGKNNLNVPIFPRLLSAAGGGSGGVIIHVNTADHMTVSSSSNCNLQTGSAQQQGKRVREGGFFVCLQIRNNASLFSSKFYFWLSHKFECTCDRFWAKWEFCNFSIFLWFSDSVGLWWISRSHDMYRAQNWSQQLLKMHLNDCCSTWVWCCIYQLPCTSSTSTSTQLATVLEMHSNCRRASPYLALSKNCAELWGCTPSLAN